MSNFSLIIPIFNESENIFDLLNEIEELSFNHYEYEIIVVNDASTDNVIEIFNTKKYKKNIKLYSLPNRFGQSNAIHKGIQVSKFSNIVTIDGDGQNDPKDIEKLLITYFSNNELSLVAGIRKKRKDNIIKKISSLIANKIRMLYLNDKCKDTGCSLKIFKKKIFMNFIFFDGIHRFIPSLFEGCGYKAKYIEVNHRKRRFGNSKYDTFKRLYRGVIDMYNVKKQIRLIKK